MNKGQRGKGTEGMIRMKGECGLQIADYTIRDPKSKIRNQNAEGW